MTDNKSIVDLYTKVISEQTRKERGELVEAAFDSLHMSSASHGAGNIHITDMPHSEKSISHIEKGIGERLHKAHPDKYKSAAHATEAYRDAHSEQENEGFGHHALATAEDKRHKPIAKMSASKYMDSEAKSAHSFIQGE